MRAPDQGRPRPRRLTARRSAAVLALLVALVFALVYGEFLAGRYVYAYRDSGADTINQYLPRLAYLAGQWQTDGRPAWTFRQVLGNGLEVSLRPALADPFYAVLVAARRPSLIPAAMVWLTALKALLAAWIAYRFLRAVRASRFAARAGALLYAFNGYFVLAGQHYHLGTSLLCLPLVLWGFERFRRRGATLLFPLAVAWTAFSFYRLYVVTPVLGLYAVMRGAGPGPGRDRLPRWFGLAGLYALGVALGGMFFLPSLLGIARSPRVQGAAADWLARGHLPSLLAGLAAAGAAAAALGWLGRRAFVALSDRWTALPPGRRARAGAALVVAGLAAPAAALLLQRPLARLAGRNGLGLFHGLDYFLAAAARILAEDVSWRARLNPSDWWNVYDYPHLYAGLAALVLAPQVFAGLRTAQRPAYVAGGLAVYAALTYQVVAWALSGFARVDYRWMFVLMPFAAWHAAAGIDTLLRGAGRRALLAVAAAAVAAAGLVVCLLCAAFAAQQGRGFHPPLAVAGRIALFAAAHGAALAWLARRPARRGARTVFVGLVALEAVVFCRPLVADRDRVEPGFFAGQRAYTARLDAVTSALGRRGPSFFRMHKDFASNIYGETEPLLLERFFTTGGFLSLPNPHTIAFYRALDVDYCTRGNENCIHGVGTGRPWLQGLLAVRYLLSKDPGTPEGYDDDGEIDAFRVLRNRAARPLGFVYRRAVRRTAFDALPPAARDRLLHEAMVWPDGAPLPPGVTEAGPASLPPRPPDQTAAAGAPPFRVTAFREDRLAGDVNTDAPGLLFLSIPYDAGWQAWIDGRPVAPVRVNIGFLGLPLEAGSHRVELAYRSAAVRAGTRFSLAGLAGWLVLAAAAARRARARAAA